MSEPLPCIFAWRGLSTDVNGSIRPCCRYAQPEEQDQYSMPWMKDGFIGDLFNGKQLVKLREALLRGEKVPECKSCWIEEAAGNRSYRQHNNDFFVTMYDETFDINQLNSNVPVYLDLKLSNVCNLMCRMCSPQASSMIQKESERLNPSFKGDPYWKASKIVGTSNEDDFVQWLPYIKAITITGGDPFVGKENKDIIQLICDRGYANCIDVHFNTNGMLMPTGYLDLLTNFKKVSIAFSIDDIGDRLSYQRHGADQKTFEENWNKVPSSMRKHIYITVNNYNVWYLLESFSYFKSLTNYISYDFVHDPAYLNISHLNSRVKDLIIKKYTNAGNCFWTKLINFIQIESDDLTADFINHAIRVDKTRNEDFFKVFPEWASVLLA